MNTLGTTTKVALFVVLVPIACFASAWMNAPSTMGGGPFAIDLSFPVGFLAASFAMILLERAEPPAPVRRVAYGSAALALFLAAGSEFHAFPPLEDGAFLLLRYPNDPEIGNYWPASAFAHAMAFVPFEWSLFLALRPRIAPEERNEGASGSFAVRSIAGLASAGVGSLALERHAESLVMSSRGSSASLAIVATVAFGATLFARRSQAALVVAIVAFTTLLAMAACSSIYDAVV